MYSLTFTVFFTDTFDGVTRLKWVVESVGRCVLGRQVCIGTIKVKGKVGNEIV